MDQEKKRNVLWQEIEPYCVLRTVWKNLWMVLLSAVLFVMLAYCLTTLLMKPSYTCTTTFAVTPKYSNSAYITSSSVTESTAQQFADLLNSSPLKKQVSKVYGNAVAGAAVDAAVVENTNLIALTVSASSPRTAYYMTYGILEHYQEFSKYVLESVVLEQVTTPTVPANDTFLATQRKIILISAPLGAALMAVLLAVLSILSRTVQTVTGARNQVDAPLLVTVNHQKKHRTLKSAILRKKSALLISNPTTSFLYVETIHQLRARVEHERKHEDCKTFLITSVGENEGKSTVAANLALSLAKKYKRVLLVDCDLRKAAQHLIFEAKPDPAKTVPALLKGELDPSVLVSALQYRKSDNLFCLFSSNVHRHSAELLGSQQMERLLGVLRENFDYVILDSSPMGYFTDSQVLADLADASILVLRQDNATDVAANDAIDTLSRCQARFMGFVFNDVHTLNLGATLVGGRRYGYGYGYSKGYGYGYGYSKGYGYGGYGKGYGYGRSDGYYDKNKPTVDQDEAAQPGKED